MNTLVNLIKVLGDLIQEINHIFYFPFKLDTYLPWGVFFLMWLMYRMLKQFMRDQILTSSEFLQLMGVYALFLCGIIASYTDFDVLMDKVISDHAYRKSMFAMMMIMIIAMVTLIGIMGANKNAAQKSKIILTVLYFPIVLMMLTNGDILEQGPRVIQSYMPKVRLPFVGPPLKQPDKKYFCNVLDPKEVEDIIKQHSDVADCVVVVNTEGYKVSKPYAFVVLHNKVSEQDKAAAKTKIRDFAMIQFRLKKLEPYKEPSGFEILDEMPKTPGGRIKREVLEKRVAIQ